ncbi:hypothetical protein NliqN6_5897 [Naganishia liquefaciens]|uniref:Survival protein SurE-like phosphatase/nucleotidase domain-containing protein n=1 Tax=Naganishia liquefaciens TaxID=104408 RepID=A0A8H3TYE5_9TREE|nr:hypothetical protein NliqN6_5897 [Naganishia liquefaciens]
MRWTALTVAAGLLSTASAHLNIVMTNDDGFGTANIRALYNELTRQNHTVLIVGPAENQSGVGGTTVWPTSNLTRSGRDGLLTPGAFYAGQEPGLDNPGITYFNGTPAACVFYALDVVAPVFFKNKPVDLVVSGPNEGSNLGPLVFTLSGTLGAAYVAVGRGIPAVAFSAGNSTKRSYKDWDPEDPTDIANVQAKLGADLVSALAYGVDTSKGEKVLPTSLGLNVNFPKINATCGGLPMVQTRMTGDALTDKVVFTSAGFPTWGDLAGSPGVNTCINGDCSLPSETSIATTTCMSSVTAFSVDYDSPQAYTAKTKEHLEYTVLGKMNTAPGSYKREWVPRGRGAMI